MTRVVRLDIEEASAKIRTGPPRDEDEALAVPVWAGELPLHTVAGFPVRDVRLRAEQALSPAVADLAQALGGEPLVESTRDDFLLSTDRGRLDFEMVHRFLAEESYWARGITTDRLRVALAHSLCFGLYHRAALAVEDPIQSAPGDAVQIGFARVVSDRARFAWLADVFIRRDYRGRGLGSWLVSQVIAHPAVRDVDKWQLGTRDAQWLYAKFGWRSVVKDNERGVDFMVRERPCSGVLSNGS
jgi:GNAT superfamily N-acetyltransferase